MGAKERREREKEQRRRQIQEAAKYLFIKKGFTSSTIEDIANRAELSPGAIYSYFKSKEELLASLILLPLGYLFKRSQEVYEDDSLRVDEKMVAFLEVMYDTFKYDQLMLRNIFHLQIEDTLETLSPDLLQEIQYVIRKLISMWASVYQAGVDEGRFVAAPPIVQADIMWSTFSGLVMWEEAKRKLNPAKDYLKPTLDWAFQVMLNGIRKR